MIIVKLKGGLGNQMFQYAFGKSLSLQLHQQLILDLGFLEASPPVADITPRFFELSVFDVPEKKVHDTPRFGLGPAFPYRLNKLIDPLLKTKRRIVLTDNNMQADLSGKETIILDGYFQKESCFLKEEEAIRNAFVFNLEKLGSENKLIMDKIRRGKSVSVHIRRGDYVTNPATNTYHGVCSPAYYKQAIKLLQQSFGDLHFFVFSDDLDWCKSNLREVLPETSSFVSHNTGRNSYKDMLLMSQCRHHIIANSSFSWWAAWLNPSAQKMVIAPRQWFTDPTLNTGGLYPKTWHLI